MRLVQPTNYQGSSLTIYILGISTHIHVIVICMYINKYYCMYVPNGKLFLDSRYEPFRSIKR